MVRVFLVGKGVTYDTGGLNIKPSGFMEDMYIDKGGASTVFGAFTALVNLGVKQNVTMVTPLAENAIGKDAYKPSEIIRAYNDLTVEITNTDAEGRLILGDAMSYIQRTMDCKHMVELSTLTGACLVALGSKIGGLFSNDQDMASRLLESSRNRNSSFVSFGF